MNNGNKSSSSTASLVCSIISFLILPFIFGVAGIILGIIGISNQEEKKTYALIGIVMGVISVLYAFYVSGVL